MFGISLIIGGVIGAVSASGAAVLIDQKRQEDEALLQGGDAADPSKAGTGEGAKSIIAETSDRPAVKEMIKSLRDRKHSKMEIAQVLLHDMQKSGRLALREAQAIDYVAKVIAEIQSDESMVSVPAMLVDVEEDEDPDEAEYLRDNFTPTRHSKRRSTQKSFRGLTRGMTFALRLKKNVTKKNSLEAGAVIDLPYLTSADEMAEITSVLVGVSKWDFDIFKLSKATNGRELTTLAWHLLHKYNLFEKFNLEKAKFKAWLFHIEGLYNDTPYHSKTHAADVLQTVHFFLSTCNAADFLTEIQILALILAAVVHDVGHDGFNNAFHQAALTDRAVSFNDQSIQENFHLSTMYLALHKEDSGMNIFSTLNNNQVMEMRRMMISMVLGTDMTRHFNHFKEFKSALDLCGKDATCWESHVDVLMSQILHVADISNPAKPRDTAVAWAELVVQEFFAQGDREKSLGLPISPMCNRETTNLSATQIGFIKYIVLPTYELLAELLPEVETTCLSILKENLEYWEERGVKEKRESLERRQSGDSGEKSE